MADNTTISAYDISAPPMFRLVESGDSTIIQDYATSTPLWRVNGKIGGGVEVMTHDERIRIIPAAGDLIYDTSDHNLYVGDGHTPGGIAVSGGTVPEFLVLGEWTDEDEDIYVVGDWTR